MMVTTRICAKKALTKEDNSSVLKDYVTFCIS